MMCTRVNARKDVYDMIDPSSLGQLLEEIGMPALSTIVVFLLAGLGILLIPGPDVLYIVTRSMAQGRRAGLAPLGSIETTNVVHRVAAALGLSTLLMTSALAFSVVKYLGAAY